MGLFGDSWSNVVDERRNDLVFEERNREYGAFVLRREYTRGLWIALIIASSALILTVSLPKIIELFKGKEEEAVKAVDITEVDLVAPPPVDESEPPPPPPPPPPVMETVKFTPPVVVDEKVEEEQPIITQETETQISTVTQEGTGGEEIIIPVENPGNGIVEQKEEIFQFVEEMPSFPGGETEMMKYIQKNVVYPQVEKENGISGKVYLKFVVDKDGKVGEVQIARGIPGGKALEAEAIRVVKSMPPWKPGKNNGRAVSVWFNLPVSFVLK